ncbi:carboxymuconolactone decarboxylase family protein [Streptomyces sp. NPDC050264]|uniref:carboxymuconolactone decarboxylase family protein n=1 Tax=Streptomyces sp. NPDC050264 TaxID=3155038 RepID=UPI00341A99CD
MTTTRDAGLALLQEILPEVVSGSGPEATADGEGFAAALGELSLENVFGQLWTRPGLDRRARSLVTLGVLIALRAEDELRFHFTIGLRNGLTREELEEVVYHASGYAGFPAASTAARVGREVLDQRTNDQN